MPITREQLDNANFPDFVVPGKYATNWLKSLQSRISQLEAITQQRLPEDVVKKHVGSLIVNAIDDACNPLMSAIGFFRLEDVDGTKKLLAFTYGWECTWEASNGGITTLGNRLPPQTLTEYQLVFEQYAGFNGIITAGKIEDLAKSINKGTRFAMALNLVHTYRSGDFKKGEVALALNLLNPLVLGKDKNIV